MILNLLLIIVIGLLYDLCILGQLLIVRKNALGISFHHVGPIQLRLKLTADLDQPIPLLLELAQLLAGCHQFSLEVKSLSLFGDNLSLEKKV